MEFTRWTERYSVGDPLMDAYHHIFFKTLEDFARELAELAPAAVEERIAFLLNYAAMHFDSEEQLMREVAFPELEAHRELHRTFKERLKRACRTATSPSPPARPAQELLELSEAWLREHILGEDMKYKPYPQALTGPAARLAFRGQLTLGTKESPVPRSTRSGPGRSPSTTASAAEPWGQEDGQREAEAAPGARLRKAQGPGRCPSGAGRAASLSAPASRARGQSGASQPSR